MKLLSYLELTKVRVNSLVIFTALAGFVLASGHDIAWLLLCHVLIGTSLVAGGSCAINECWERELDARMPRTQSRPLPEGRLSLVEAWSFSILISVVGTLYLYWFVNLLSSVLALITLLIYVFLYTPFKRKSSASTLVGAISGAIPPMIGWAAVRNDLAFEAWILFLILFFWQIPAFLSIAWIYREDYSKAQFPMLTVIDTEKGGMTSSQILLFSGGLFWVSLFPTFMGVTGWLYFLGAITLSGTMFFLGYLFSKSTDSKNKNARKVFIFSMLYLPLLFTLLILDRNWI